MAPTIITAHGAYVNQQSRAQDLMARLTSVMKEHASAHANDQRNWHLVGDLATACDHLERAARLLGVVIPRDGATP